MPDFYSSCRKRRSYVTAGNLTQRNTQNITRQSKDCAPTRWAGWRYNTHAGYAHRKETRFMNPAFRRARYLPSSSQVRESGSLSRQKNGQKGARSKETSVDNFARPNQVGWVAISLPS